MRGPSSMRNSGAAEKLPDSFVEQTLSGQFSITARRFGACPAVDDDARSFSYGELEIESDGLAQLIGQSAGGRELPVCLLMDQGADLIVAILAVLKSGRAYVPVDRFASIEEIRSVVADTGSRLLICDKGNEPLAARLAGSEIQYLPIDAPRKIRAAPTEAVAISPDDNAYIYYTSGTTGPAKGVVDVHRNVLHNILRYTNSLAIGADDRLSLIQSSNFSGTVSTIFSALLNGASLFPFDFRRRGAEQLAQWINAKQITIFHSVPLIFEQLMDTGLQFPSLRLIRLEGDQMLPRHLSQFKQRFGKDCVLVNGLASTETGLIRQNFLRSDSDTSTPVVPVGYPVRDMEVFIRLADGRVGAETETGEIVVRSRFLAKGYWRRPDLTAAKFVDPPDRAAAREYHTGDLGRMVPGGCLEHLGRGDSLTRVRGRFADLSAIEFALCQVPGIRHALAKPDDGPAGGQQLVAYIVRHEGAKLNASDLRLALSKAMPRWQVPAHFVFLDALPADPHGKVARHLLPARSQERPDLAAPYLPPRSFIERELAACFADVLKVRPVGVHDDFFDLGGDSLSATNLSFEIEKKFEVCLSPELIFDHPTVSALQSHLRDSKRAATAYPLRSAGSRPPLFCVHVSNHFASGYRSLAKLLDEDQPVYVLRDCPPMTSVGEIASAFLSEMLSVQPAGPYRICGNCFSGTIAYEMARQLQARGETVGFLGLIDTAFPPRKNVSDGYAVAVARTSRWRHISRSRLAKLAVNLGMPFFRPWLKLHHAVEIAENRYRPRPISGDAVLFIIGQIDNQAGWRDLCGDRLAIVRIADANADVSRPKPHLIDEPYVAELALELTSRLRS